MMKFNRFFIAALVVGLNASAWAKVTLTETTDYAQIENIVKAKEKLYRPDKILLVLDIDNTLLTSGTNLGGDIWYKWQAGKLPIKPSEDEKVPCLYNNAIALLYQLGPLKLTEEKVPGLIKEWQQKHTTFALTSRSPDTRYSTLRELRRNGIDFSASALAAPGQTEAPLEQGKLQRSWLYSDGVFFSSGQNKGFILDFLLKKTGRQFDAIIFVDDGKYNIDAMEKMLNTPQYLAVDASMIYYTRVKSELIERQKTILTPEQAQQMTQDWKLLSSTLNKIYPDSALLCPTHK